MAYTKVTTQEVIRLLQHASQEEFEVLERSFIADTRITVQRALQKARRRIELEEAERARVAQMYQLEAELSRHKISVGLDEVGRGPLAGPLTIGAVILDMDMQIPHLNDSKQLTEARREELALQIKEQALAWHVEHIDPQDIDEYGMSVCLRKAFSQALYAIEETQIPVETVLLDGNPLHIDKREIAVVKGDSTIASISAASIIAKVSRDAIMREYDKTYPEYGFSKHKGYGARDHILAIRRYGLTPIHRASFCHAFTQESLF